MIRAWLMTVVAVGAACATSPPLPPPPEPPKAQLVSATIATNGCATLAGVNGRLAEEAMYKLVDECASVPGGSTKFTVTLLPGGGIEFPKGPDQPDTIPTCVLRRGLGHRVRLAKPCSLVVKLEEKSVSLPTKDASAPKDAP